MIIIIEKKVSCLALLSSLTFFLLYKSLHTLYILPQNNSSTCRPDGKKRKNTRTKIRITKFKMWSVGNLHDFSFFTLTFFLSAVAAVVFWRK